MFKLNIILLILILPLSASSVHLDSLYQAIDEAIANSDYYINIKERKLDSLSNEVAKSIDLKQRFDAEMKLYNAYFTFQNDSAIATLHRALDIAQAMHNNNLIYLVYAKLTYQHSLSGYFFEATIFNKLIPSEELDSNLLVEYYYTSYHLNTEMAGYSKETLIAEEANNIAVRYLDSLIAIIPKDSLFYLEYLESQYNRTHNYNEALRINDLRLQNCIYGSHDYAKVCFNRACDYRELGNYEEYKLWLAQSAYYDIINGIMDQTSLWVLAGILSDEGDLERSYLYVKYSWTCATRFSGKVLAWLIPPILTVINEKYKENINSTNKKLSFLMIIAIILVLLMTVMYLYAVYKRKQLFVAQKQLKLSNENLTLRTNELNNANKQLSYFNNQLSSLNAQLTSLNSKLNESNQVKVEYIGKFFSQCSEYIDKLDQYRIMVKRKVKTRQFDELLKVTNDEQMKENELLLLFNDFDSIFLHIFPTFVEDMNALLKPEYRTSPSDNHKLSTDARIMALIRLGIEDSSKIAEFLHYAPNTIYNYRTRLKSKAINRDNFEEQVKKINCVEDKSYIINSNSVNIIEPHINNPNE